MGIFLLKSESLLRFHEIFGGEQKVPMLSKSSLAFTLALGWSRRTFIPITDSEIFLFASCLD